MREERDQDEVRRMNYRMLWIAKYLVEGNRADVGTGQWNAMSYFSFCSSEH